MSEDATGDIALSDLQLDALTELVNLGVSLAAGNLAVMVREEVVLSGPRVALMTRQDAIQMLNQRDSRSLVHRHQIARVALLEDLDRVLSSH